LQRWESPRQILGIGVKEQLAPPTGKNGKSAKSKGKEKKK
jgi:hypothetical protein